LAAKTVITTEPSIFAQNFYPMTRKLLWMALSALLFLQISCLKANTDCGYAQCKFVAPDTQIQELQAYINTNGLTATRHCSGAFYNIISAGTGKNPDPCSYVFVKYTGRTTSGFVFDQRTTTAVLINLNQVVSGWRACIPLLKEGGSMTLYVPPYLGYGNQDIKDANGNVLVPGNSILIFDIELVSIEK
jgi:FKBP-type peptidyl-prolyl cis-trans isomerase FkpA